MNNFSNFAVLILVSISPFMIKTGSNGLIGSKLKAPAVPNRFFSHADI
jgi:hypothetical protein